MTTHLGLFYNGENDGLAYGGFRPPSTVGVQPTEAMGKLGFLEWESLGGADLVFLCAFQCLLCMVVLDCAWGVPAPYDGRSTWPYA